MDNILDHLVAKVSVVGPLFRGERLNTFAFPRGFLHCLLLRPCDSCHIARGGDGGDCGCGDRGLSVGVSSGLIAQFEFGKPAWGDITIPDQVVPPAKVTRNRRAGAV